MRRFTTGLAALGVVAALAFGFSAPANAQAIGDAFANSGAGVGNYGNTNAGTTGSQSQTGTTGVAPALQGATNGTIGPQGADAT